MGLAWVRIVIACSYDIVCLSRKRYRNDELSREASETSIKHRRHSLLRSLSIALSSGEYLEHREY